MHGTVLKLTIYFWGIVLLTFAAKSLVDTTNKLSKSESGYISFSDTSSKRIDIRS